MKCNSVALDLLFSPQSREMQGIREEFYFLACLFIPRLLCLYLNLYFDVIERSKYFQTRLTSLLGKLLLVVWYFMIRIAIGRRRRAISKAREEFLVNIFIRFSGNSNRKFFFSLDRFSHIFKPSICQTFNVFSLFTMAYDALTVVKFARQKNRKLFGHSHRSMDT